MCEPRPLKEREVYAPLCHHAIVGKVSVVFEGPV